MKQRNPIDLGSYFSPLACESVGGCCSFGEYCSFGERCSFGECCKVENELALLEMNEKGGSLDVEILYVFVDIDSLPMLREFDTTIEIVLPLSMQYFKHITGHKELPTELYVASYNPVHLHIDVNPS